MLYSCTFCSIRSIIPIREICHGKGNGNVRELYELIEQKIKASGYPGEIDGAEFYDDISDEAENQDLGMYLFFIKKTDTLSYKGCITIMVDEFDLHTVDIIDGDQVYHVDFDAE